MNNDTEEENTSKKEKNNLINAMQLIAKQSEDSELDENFYEENFETLVFLEEAFGITWDQVVMLCLALERGPRNVDYDDISRHLNIGRIRALAMGKDIDELVKRRFMRYHNVHNKDSFYVINDFIKALRNNQVYSPPKNIGLDCNDIFNLLKDYFDDLNDNEVEIDELTIDIKALLNNNTQVPFAKKVLDYQLNDIDMMILVKFCHLLVNENDDRVFAFQLRVLFSDLLEYNNMKSDFRNGCHILMTKGIIECLCEDGVANSSSYHLTQEAKLNLLSEIKYSINELKLAGLIKPEKITAKELFFPKEIEAQVNELNGFFDEKEFVKIKQRMSEKGFRSSFTCLFYGPPGTGKTETAYQLARTTGRSIIVVDVPQIKSKWVGDSEKNIKALFDNYRGLVRQSKVAPILLFNEADAIIGTRKNGAENAVDKMENSIQNIILNEMENLDGIMIATTNLVGNLDVAFERRFLYKIMFAKPDATVRRRIWQQMIPELTDDQANTLAMKFELSGGQIENVARKDAINFILQGEVGDHLATLINYCKAERIVSAKAAPNRVGF